MTDLKTPERRDSEEEIHQPEPEAEETKIPPGHLEVRPSDPGNIDLINLRLLEAINKKMSMLIQMLDVRLPRLEEAVSEEE